MVDRDASVRARLRRVRDFLGRPTVRRALADACSVALALAAGLAAFSLGAHGRLTVGPAELSVSLAPSLAPRTLVEVPPFGSVEAVTHKGPLLLVVRLEQLDLARTTRMVSDGDLSLPETIPPEASEVTLPGSAALARRLIGGGLLASVLAAALVSLALRRRRAVVAIAVALSLMLPATAVWVAWATWDATSFRNPVMRGSLAHVPQLLDVFSTRVASIERLREQAGELASDLEGYYADERSLAVGGSLPGTYRVLHVSDLHLDPVGAELARSVARSYEASLVVDTGDLSLLGSDIEAGLFDSLIDTSARRVFVPGNHDSPATLDALREAGVTVLASGTVEVDGLRILGIADPGSGKADWHSDDAKAEKAGARAFAEIRRAAASGEATPDVVAVHNPVSGVPFAGAVGLVLSGHTHSARLRFEDGTVLLTSGALEGEPQGRDKYGRAVPHSLSVLYFTADKPRRLVAIDRIDVYSTNSATVSRVVVDESLLP